MAIGKLWRDFFRAWTPVWLSDRPGEFTGATVGYRVLWLVHAKLDDITEALMQGLASWMPGLGTVSALPLIGQSRGLLRGKGTSDDDYAVSLRAWRQKWPFAGTREGLARALHDYLAGRPQVDVVNRAGAWTRVNADGTVTQFRNVPWNWDGTSNPERAAFWSELWVIIRSPYAERGGTIGSLTSDTNGLGLLVPQSDVDELKALVATWKSAASRIRCVIWCNNPSLFDPATPGTLPDGTWGQWSKRVADGSGGVKTEPSNRDTVSCRYWEPN